MLNIKYVGFYELLCVCTYMHIYVVLISVIHIQASILRLIIHAYLSVCLYLSIYL